jgi:hypothetical protein
MNRLLRVLLLTLTIAFGAGAADVFAQETFYWLGVTGDWNDPARWSRTPGGAPIDPSVDPPPFFPNETVNVVFNTGSTYTVSIDVNASCADMDWRNATGNPTLAGTGSLAIYGSLYLINNMSFTFSGPISFRSTTNTEKIIQTNNKEFRASIEFDGNGSWRLENPLITLEDINIKRGTLNANNQIIRLNRNWIVGADGSFNSGTGTVIFEGTLDSRIELQNANADFNNVVINKTIGTTTPSVSNFSAIRIKNDLTITSGELRDRGFQINTQPFTNTGRITVSDAGILSIGGNDNTTPTQFPTFANRTLTTNSTVDYRALNDGQRILNTTYGNLILSNGFPGANPQRRKILDGAITVNGSLSVASDINFVDNGFQITGNNNPGRTLSLQGNATLTLGNPNSNAAGTTMPDFPIYDFNAVFSPQPSIVSTVIYTAGGNQTIKGLNGAGNASYGNLVLTNPTTTNRTKSLDNDVNIRGNLTIGANNTLDVSSNNYRIDIQGDWISRLNTPQPNGTNLGSFTARAGTVNFNGSINQFVSVPFTNSVSSRNRNYKENTYSFNRIVINNSSTSGGVDRYGKTYPGVIINSPITVSDNIDFQNGDIISRSDRNTATADDEVIYSGTRTRFNAKNGSHVVGPFRKSGNTDFEFPIGNGSYYRPMASTGYSNQGNTLIAEYFGVSPDPPYTLANVSRNGNPPLAGSPSRYEYWTLDLIQGSANTKVQLSWLTNANPDVEGPSGTQRYLGWRENIVVAAYRIGGNGQGSWENAGGSGRTGDLVNGTVNADNAINANLNIFTLGGVTHPLPIELLYFRAQLQEKAVQFKWATAKEINNDYFTVEKSADGQNFSDLLQVKGAGNSQEMRQYTAQDASPYNGVTYYRLKQTDKDVTVSYSKIEAVHSGKDGSLLQVYQPASGQLQVNYQLPAEASGTLRVYDSRGVQVWGKQVSANATSGRELIPMGTARGLYLVSLHTTGGTTIKRIVVY